MAGFMSKRRREPLVLYYNRTNAARGEKPWVVMRMFVGDSFSQTVSGSKVGSFGTSSEALLWTQASLAEDLWATPALEYPDAYPRAGCPRRVLYRVVAGADGPEIDASVSVDTMLRRPFEEP